MGGRTRSIRPRVPRAGLGPPKVLLRLLDPAGQVLFPVRDFKARAANRLLKGKEVRVFLSALDESWRVRMSKDFGLINPNYVLLRGFVTGPHCIPPLESLISSKKNMRANLSLENWPRKHDPGRAAGGCAWGSADGESGGAHQGKSHRCTGTGRRLKSFDAGQIEPGQAIELLHCNDAEMTMEDCGFIIECGIAGPGHTLPTNPGSHYIGGHGVPMDASED
jgi:hypothetical protein